MVSAMNKLQMDYDLLLERLDDLESRVAEVGDMRVQLVSYRMALRQIAKHEYEIDCAEMAREALGICE